MKATRILQAWSNSFYVILEHAKFMAYCNSEIDVTTIYDMVYILYKVELDMNKVVAKRKAIMDAKWSNCLDEFNTIKDATWLDVDTDISIWEAIANIKAIPLGDSK